MKTAIISKNVFLLAIIFVVALMLRFYNLSSVPPGLYIDEISIGYNAHTILTKGVDEYGTPYPLAFKTFGDYKMPVYIYLTALSEAIFGKNEFAIRFPSAFFGTVAVLMIYFLLKELIQLAKLQKDSFYTYLPVISAFILAISPWHIQFSRGGFEVNVALTFYLVALYFICRYLNKNSLIFLLLSAVFFVLTFYTYFVYRILTPLTILILIICLVKIKKLTWKNLLFFLLIIGMLSLPTFLFSFSSEGMARFSQTSLFNEIQAKTLWEKLYLYPLIYLRNYFSHFSLPFLFVAGDGFGRHQMPWFGPLLKWQLPFILYGIFILLRSKKNVLQFGVIGLFLLSPIAASFAIPSPHTLRDLPMVIPLAVLTGIGIISLYRSGYRLLKVFVVALFFIGVFEFGTYLHFYYSHYPKVNGLDWGGAYKEVVQETSIQKDKYAAILVDSKLSFAKTYIHYYDESLSPIVVTDSWVKPKDLEGKTVLFIRPAGINSAGKRIKTIYLPESVNNDAFAELWEVKE